MAAQNPPRQDLRQVLDNIGHPACRACIETSLPGCLHNGHDVLMERLRAILGQYITDSPQNECHVVQPIYYRFDEWRGGYDLGATQLQAPDLAKLEAVQSIAAELQVNVYLARLQRTERGITYEGGTSPNIEETEDEENDDEAPESSDDDGHVAAPETRVAEIQTSIQIPRTSADEDIETDWSVNILLDNRRAIDLPLDVNCVIQGGDFFDLEDPDDEDIDDGLDWWSVSTMSNKL